MQLAYVFWHWPASGIALGEYEARLAAFHRALDNPCGSWTARLGRPPFDAPAATPVYEDWYAVASWHELGVLAERAVADPARAPHDAAAVRSAGGAAGVYRRARRGGLDTAPSVAAWLAKPDGCTYAEALGALGDAAPHAAVWVRQLVLGPAPEIAVLARAPLDLPWPALGTDPQPIDDN
jgi:hypothetical protein